jgi:hypothetical protein
VGAEGEGTWRKSCSVDEWNGERRERTWRGEKVWDEAMSFIQEKIPRNKPMSEDVRNRGNMYCTATQNDRRSHNRSSS